jgi:cell wall-associated NlpC family hydrolase
MPRDHAEERDRIVAAARGWIGTPFHNVARVKGAGVDCAQLVAGVYEEAGVTPHIEAGYYAPQFMLHCREERLAEFVARYAHEIDERDAGPGDIVLYKVGHSFSHAAIIVDWPHEIIHAHMLSRKVIAMEPFSADMHDRQTRFFSVWR